ncbi:5111_t:CDS:2, partial [Acaulospora morrowiae]
KFNRILVNASWQSLLEVDHVLVIVDSHRAECMSTYSESCLFNRLKDYELPSTLVLNKVDLLQQTNRADTLRRLEENFRNQYPFFKKIVCVSALERQGLDNLFSYSYDQEWVYPAEVKYEMADLKRVEDLIRAELLDNLRSYLSYCVKQENEGWTLLSNGTLRIDQTLYVERESQQARYI